MHCCYVSTAFANVMILSSQSTKVSFMKKPFSYEQQPQQRNTNDNNNHNNENTNDNTNHNNENTNDNNNHNNENTNDNTNDNNDNYSLNTMCGVLIIPISVTLAPSPEYNLLQNTMASCLMC